MEQLPDDVLLAIFTYIDLKDVLAVRAVCLRWRDLILHPDVWRHHVIPAGFLRIAPPCCYKLDLQSPLSSSDGFLAATTKCVATSLSINIQTDAVLAALIIRLQASHGRLRELELCVPSYGSSVDVYSVLLSIEGLHTLVFESKSPVSPFSQLLRWTVRADRLDGLTVRPSLQKLISRVVHLPSFLLEKLVQTHASCLQSVSIKYIDPWNSNVAGLLSNVTHLREVACPLMEGLDLLLHCRCLRTFALFLEVRLLNDARRRALASAATLLRSATFLNKVTLEYKWRVVGLEGLGEELVRALGHSGHSEVTHLRVSSDGPIHSDALWTHIMPTLHKLPRLEKLSYEGAIGPDWFNGLDPLSIPKLTCFEVWNLEACPCCSWQKVCRMLQANPQLRLDVSDISYGPKCENGCNDCIVGPTNNLTYQTAISARKHVSVLKNDKS